MFVNRMSDLSNDKLTEHLTDAKHALSLLPDHVDNEPAIQLALQALMEAREDIVERFQRLVDECPEVAKRVLLSSVSSLVNLHVVQSVTAELNRRAEAN